MRVTLILLLFCALAHASIRRKRQGFIDLTSSSRRCTTPLGKPGICLGIKKCGALVTLLVQHRHKQEVVNYLRKSVCSYDNLEPVVCCSEIEGGLIEGTTQNNISPEPTRPSPPSSSRPGSSFRPSPNPSTGFTDNDRVNGLLPRSGECGISASSNLRIVGGGNASAGDWPWVVAMGYRSSRNPGKIVYLCGGSIITPYHILTAAHCVYNKRNLVTVRAGDLNLYDDLDQLVPVEIPISGSVIHPDYNPTTFVNDIAILRLSRPLQFTKYIQPVCLPLSGEFRRNTFVGSKPFVAGWGTTSFDGPSSNTLQYLQMPVVKESECKRAYTPFKTAVIDQRVLCAGFLRGGRDACKGDSGGPLMAYEFVDGRGSFIQIGVVSYGYKCAEPGFPGVYTRVTSFADWIIDNLR